MVIPRKPSSDDKAQIAWKRIETLGGQGVWESDLVVVSLAGTGVTDRDLELFEDFPDVEILDLSETIVSDQGLDQIANLPALNELILVNTRISAEAIERFQSEHPTISVTTEPPPKDAINPFTGKPL